MSGITTHTNGAPPDGGDGIDRRGFLECMAWVGTGVVWAVHGGVLSSRTLAQVGAEPGAGTATPADFTFVQISDSHIGFGKDPNKDVTGTLRLAVERINALPQRPDLVLHTGDLTHLARPEEFDTVAEIVKQINGGEAFYVPGEHDIFTDDAKLYLERHGKGTLGQGWRSFDHKGVHFVGLVNVMNLGGGGGAAGANGLGVIGPEQLAWLKKDLEGLSAETPVVVYAHVPLWTVYEDWGWGTKDSAEALALLKRFGSVTVLNGHVHQVLQKVEGNIVFHTALSTAFPQPAPGTAPSPGPMKNVAADKLKSMLGLRSISVQRGKSMLAVVDSTLA